MPSPLCTVVLVSWNRLDALPEALASVFRQTIADRLDVIVIDNGSTDGTREWLRDECPHPIRLFAFARNEGACAARNAAIRLARAPRVAFLDSDAYLLTPDALERCLAALDQGPERAVSGFIWFDAERTRLFLSGGHITPDGHFWGRRSLSPEGANDPQFLSTCFAVWEKALLEELRGFDPWYFWGIEDLDLSLRARWNARRGRAQGATRFRVLPHVHVHHDMSRQGRHVPADDWVAKFRYFEPQRLYLVLSYGGLREFAKVLLRTPLRLRRVETDAWEHPLTWRQKAFVAVVCPLRRLLALPKDLAAQRRNHLAEAPMPEALQRLAPDQPRKTSVREAQ